MTELTRLVEHKPTPEALRKHTGSQFVHAVKLLHEGKCRECWQLRLAIFAVARFREDLVQMGHARDVLEVWSWAAREARNRSKV